ncbi:MAG: hypothetical protein EON88_11620 [Brevundimonas sp.]|nr:MAG: hypothetical protein EON88_11620 [Brevundimonas sp.]
MSNAFAPRAIDDFEDDEFDLDMGYVAQGGAGTSAGTGIDAFPGEPMMDDARRPPLQFTPPAVQAPPAPPWAT